LLKKYMLTFLSPFWGVILKLRGLSVGRGFVCIGRPGINRTSGSTISLGDEVSLCNTGIANPLAEGGRCRLATIAPGAEIKLADRVGASSSIICAATSIVIGEGTIIGGGAMILDTDFHLQTKEGDWGTDPQAVSRPVVIGRKCFIGARAIILKGVTVGDHAVIGAGSVVTRDVASNTVVAGNPATVIRGNPRDLESGTQGDSEMIPVNSKL
jgi:acetyltransferase-like isoleucine patch superfamily enzyme